MWSKISKKKMTVIPRHFDIKVSKDFDVLQKFHHFMLFENEKAEYEPKC